MDSLLTITYLRTQNPVSTTYGFRVICLIHGCGVITNCRIKQVYPLTKLHVWCPSLQKMAIVAWLGDLPSLLMAVFYIKFYLVVFNLLASQKAKRESSDFVLGKQKKIATFHTKKKTSVGVLAMTAWLLFQFIFFLIILCITLLWNGGGYLRLFTQKGGSTLLQFVIICTCMYIQRKFTFSSVNTKYISSRVLKTKEFSLMLRTRENSNVFNSLDEIYMVFTSKK